MRFCATLNNTAVASPRILIPLLETYQQEDGSVKIPEVLHPYMHGVTEIRPK
jgi:seryl-tRNA synthetase